MRFTLTEALSLFWRAWDYKLSKRNPRIFAQSEHQAMSDLTEYIVREITYRADAPHHIPSPLENFQALNVH